MKTNGKKSENSSAVWFSHETKTKQAEKVKNNQQTRIHSDGCNNAHAFVRAMSFVAIRWFFNVFVEEKIVFHRALHTYQAFRLP